MSSGCAFDVSSIDWEKHSGLVTVVAQDARTGAVLMVAHTDRDALERTIETGQMHYRSRSRGLWRKGATSGNVQRVVTLAKDCDGDAILASVIPAGPACHTGNTSCFGEAHTADALHALDEVIATRLASTGATSYTRRLIEDRNLRLKKIGEESAELVTALADADRASVVAEAADLLYHTLVAIRCCDVTLDDVKAELARRRLSSCAQDDN